MIIYGLEPDFEGIELSVWIGIREVIIFASILDTKRQETPTRRRGAPLGNKNATKNNAPELNSIPKQIKQFKNNSAELFLQPPLNLKNLNINTLNLKGEEERTAFVNERLRKLGFQIYSNKLINN